MKRIGSVIKLREDAVDEYERLHSAVWPEVLKMIGKCNIRNYSIFRWGTTLFSYFEYVGSDFEADMQKMARDPKTQEWWTFTDPLQERVPEAGVNEQWHEIKEVFHTD